MSRPLGFAGAQRRTEQLITGVQTKVSDRARDIAVQLHREAPRGGSYLNRYGQARSAPGEQPAVEEGNLLRILEMPPTPLPDGAYSVPVNYAPLEYGTMHIAPRPMGRMTIALLEQEVKSG